MKRNYTFIPLLLLLINGAAVTLKVGKKEVKLSFNTERE